MLRKLLKILFSILPDKVYIQLKYFYHFRKFANLKNPKTFNEKIQWLKLHDRKDVYSTMVDKYDAKKYVTDRIGSEYVIPAYGVWERFEDIDFNCLPNQFVLKTTHDCGGIVICRDKTSFDKKNAKVFLEKHLNFNYFKEGREWPYKNVRPRILAEQFMHDDETGELRDYKFFAFDGDVKMLFVATDRQSKMKETKFDFYDSDFKHLNVKNGHQNNSLNIEKPYNFELMKSLASKLSKGIPHIRVDFYEANGKVYFGELTFSHWSGMVPFDPPQWDEIMGDWINLPVDKRS